MSIATTTLGQSGLKATRLAFGCASLPSDLSPPSRKQAQAVLNAAWDAGIRYFDVAPHYELGVCEEHLGAFLQDKPREDYVISTKVGRVITEQANGTRTRKFDFSLNGLKRSFQGSLDRLGIDKVDILFVHDIGAPPQSDIQVEKSWQDMEAEGFDWLNQLRMSGEISGWGIGVNYVEPMMRAFEASMPDVVLLANQHSLLASGARGEFFEVCIERNISVVLGGVFNTGILATGAVPKARYGYQPAPPDILEKTRKIESVCAQFEVRLTAAALQFADPIPCVDSILVSSGKPHRLLSNIEDYAAPIPAAFWDELEAQGLANRGIS